MIEHPGPRRVVIVGGGFAGLIADFASHPRPRRRGCFTIDDMVGAHSGVADSAGSLTHQFRTFET